MLYNKSDGRVLVQAPRPSLSFAEIILITKIKSPIFHYFYRYYFNIIFFQIYLRYYGQYHRTLSKINIHEYMFVCFENMTLTECEVLVFLGIIQGRTRQSHCPRSPNFPSLYTHSMKDTGHIKGLVLYLISALIP